MGHDYTPVTTADRTYTPVSDVTPDGTIEEKFTWANIVPNYDTWIELLVKQLWCDWYFGTPYTDAFDSLTTADRTYTSVTKSDRTYIPVTTPSQTYQGVTK